MVEIGDDVDISEHGGGMNLCCPRCKSKNVEVKESREGYFWVYLCHNCGYRSEEGSKVGCIKDNPKLETGYD